MRERSDATGSETVRYGKSGPIVWDHAAGEGRAATQDDLDTLPQGDDLTEEEEEELDNAA